MSNSERLAGKPTWHVIECVRLVRCRERVEVPAIRRATATEQEERVLVASGFAAGSWRMNGWGISQDVEHAAFVPEQRSLCRYVLDVPLDCGGVMIASL